jgi:hypothetical protein
MFAVVRVYHTDQPVNQEYTGLIQQGFVPIVSKLPGFISYQAVVLGTNDLATISLFQDQAGAEASVKAAADWIKGTPQLAGVFSSPPRVMMGNVVAHA